MHQRPWCSELGTGMSFHEPQDWVDYLSAEAGMAARLCNVECAPVKVRGVGDALQRSDHVVNCHATGLSALRAPSPTGAGRNASQQLPPPIAGDGRGDGVVQ